MSGRSLSHWTPRYARDRLRWELYQRRHPDEPWLSPDANAVLSRFLLATDIGVEWGSGKSTLWLARRLGHLTSVEDVPRWHRRVAAQLEAAQVDNVTYHLAPPPPRDDTARSSDYVSVANRFEDGSLGFALVDGSAREHCAAAVLPKIAPGGVLVLDDTNGYFDYPSTSPTSRHRRGPKNMVWAQVADALAGWRMVRTTSGLKDTEIYVRPG